MPNDSAELRAQIAAVISQLSDERFGELRQQLLCLRDAEPPPAFPVAHPSRSDPVDIDDCYSGETNAENGRASLLESMYGRPLKTFRD